MMENKDFIYITSSRKGDWLAKISEIHSSYSPLLPSKDIVFSFSPEISLNDIEPVHLVTFACLIQYLTDKGHKVFMDKTNPILNQYIFKDLNFSEYWKGGKNHVDAKTSGNIFNLWRIVDSEKDLYAAKVAEYFTRTDFKDKDLSALSVSLVEAFYNVFDHAKAGRNAFLLLNYDHVGKILKVSIADFGIGIANSVRNYNPKFQSDIKAIEWAVLDHSTVKSTSHNKGLGMGNILAVATTARIFSGNGLLVLHERTTRPFTTNFSFPGTLLYMNVDLKTFDDIEILDNFSF